jgi:phosphoribosylanthranilate isomerase
MIDVGTGSLIMGRFSERAPSAIRKPVILMKTSNDSGSPTVSQQSADGTGGGVSARAGRVRVKICGITSRADALAAVSAGADALGFNTWEGSKRRMDIFSAGEWMKDLPAFVARVALCINKPLEDAVAIARLPWVDALQFHGDESSDYCEEFSKTGFPFIRAVRLGGVADLERLDGWSTSSVLVDAAVAGAYGGTGSMADLALARQAVDRFPQLSIILAGGLTPANVGEAAAIVRPYGVDVASGVEDEPARKSMALMRAFLQGVSGA